MLLKYLSFSVLLCGLVACGGGSQPSTNKDNVPIILSSSSISSQSSSSSSQHENRAPEAKVAISTQGLTVHVDGSASTDPDNDSLSYSIDYGDGSHIHYVNAWHTYTEAGNYSVRFSVSDGKLTSDKVEIVSITTEGTNHPPVARMESFPGFYRSGESQYQITSYGTLSYDEDKDPLIYTWDVAGNISHDENLTVMLDCNNTSGSSSSASSVSSSVGASKPDQLITLTVSDGKVSDTIQQAFPYKTCINNIADYKGIPDFTYRVDGLTVYLDARPSIYSIVALHWDFGDGSSEGNYWITSHTYKEPGTYKIVLTHALNAINWFNSPTTIIVTVP